MSAAAPYTDTCETRVLTEENAYAAVDRVRRDFEPGTRVAIMTVIGDWKRDIELGTVEDKLNWSTPSIVTADGVYCINTGDTLHFSHDYRGTRLRVVGMTGAGEHIIREFVRIDEPV